MNNKSRLIVKTWDYAPGFIKIENRFKKSRNKMKGSFLCLLVFLFSNFYTENCIAQDYIIANEGFEGTIDSAWVLKNSRQVEKQSYRGQKSMEVSAGGEVSRFVDIPEGVQEIVVKSWIKLTGISSNNKKIDSLSNNYVSGDTVVVVQRSSQAASILVQGADGGYIKGGQVGFVYRNAIWTYYEKEIKIPAGVKKIKISCKNTLESGKAYFDEIIITKRQLGLVKEESSWAKSVRDFNAKAKLLVKNGDFEDGAQTWNPYWGFQLSNNAHSGNYSCMIQNADSGVWRGSGNDILFRIPVGTKKLKISAWIKADNVKGGPNPWETGAMLLSLTDALGNEIPGGDAVARTVGTHDWKKFESYFNISERASNFKLLLQLAASTGKIYFDDILAETMTDEEFYNASTSLKNPGFENLLAGWPAYAGDATTDEVHDGTYSLKVASDKIGWEMRQQTLSVVKDKKQFDFSIWMKTVNVTETQNAWEGARVYLEFKDLNGISLSTETVGRAVGTTDWKEYKAKITIPEDAVEFTISCGRANVAGTAYFDDAVLQYPIEK